MSDDQTARLGLPYLAAGQMQKHVTLNEALTRLDAVVQTAIVSRTEASQPAGPPDGALYILPENATGSVWDGQPEGALLRAEGGGWSIVEAPDGLIALVLDRRTGGAPRRRLASARPTTGRRSGVEPVRPGNDG